MINASSIIYGAIEPEIPKGWHPIINELTYGLNQEVKCDWKYIRIKEKFGVLRVYTIVDNPEFYDVVDKLVEQAERKSTTTCQVCGNPGNIKEINGWLTTVCKEHTKEVGNECV